jgi:hypothetical protein
MPWNIILMTERIRFLNADKFIICNRIQRKINGRSQSGIWKLWKNEVAQLVEMLCYKLQGRGFNSQRGSWKFLMYLILQAALRHWCRLSL